MSGEEQQERTSERLARVLEERGLQALAANARRFVYDDYLSQEPMPINLLVAQLRGGPGDYGDLIERAMNGEWDGQAWEAEEWRRSPEGMATYAEFGKRAEGTGGTGAFGQPL